MFITSRGREVFRQMKMRPVASVTEHQGARKDSFKVRHPFPFRSRFALTSLKRPRWFPPSLLHRRRTLLIEPQDGNVEVDEEGYFC